MRCFPTLLCYLLPAACVAVEPPTVQDWGRLPDGRMVHLYTLDNGTGMRVRISDWGGTLVALEVPDRSGNVADVVLGFDDLESYRTRSPYFGCIIGRYGNRIAHGRFALDGAVVTLATNNAPGGMPCHLHGGTQGFDKVLWQAIPRVDADGPALELHYRSPAGEEGYPGTLDTTVTYTAVRGNALRLHYLATSDAATPVNLTNHAYFNLRGAGHGDIGGHQLTIDGANFTPVDRGLIPLGRVEPVVGTPFDFTTPHAIGERVDTPGNEQLACGGGYDHNWVLDHAAGTFARAVRVTEPTTGRVMEVWTSEPSLQFYGGNFLPAAGTPALAGKAGTTYTWRTGFCLETQHAPDSPNQPSFPSTILRPGHTYDTTTEYRFSALAAAH